MSADLSKLLAEAYEAARLSLSIREAIRAAAAHIAVEPHAAARALGFPAEFGDPPPAAPPEDNAPERAQSLEEIRYEARMDPENRPFRPCPWADE